MTISTWRKKSDCHFKTKVWLITTINKDRVGGSHSYHLDCVDCVLIVLDFSY